MDKHSFERESFLPTPTHERDGATQSYHKVHPPGHASYDNPSALYPGQPIDGCSPPNDLCVYSLYYHHQPATCVEARPKVDNSWIGHVILSIFVILCCDWPCGLAALVKALKARIYNNEGRYQEAENYAKESGTCSAFGIVCGILCSLFWDLTSIIDL